MTRSTVELQTTEVNTLSHERSWFLLPIDSDRPCYSPDTSGEDASLEACETWLKNRDYVARGDSYPDDRIFDLVSQ